MPPRRTLRGRERKPLGSAEYDVVICGASFAGLAVAGELEGTGARVLVLDRYQVGDRPTSACAAPTGWLDVLGVGHTERQRFDRLILHLPRGTVSYALPWTYSTFAYPELCEGLLRRSKADFALATVLGRTPMGGVSTDRGDIAAPLVVDATGWRGVLRRGAPGPPHAPLTRGLEVTPAGSGSDLEFWVDPDLVAAGYGWSFPAGSERRVGVLSYDPTEHVREPTARLTRRLGVEERPYHGNWIPHALKPGTQDGVFFCGDSAGQCFPLTAEGIRTAFYFGIACGRELRRVLEGRATRERALRRYESFCGRHERPFEMMLRTQRAVPALPPRLLRAGLKATTTPAFVRWSFGHYLRVAHFSFATGRRR